MSTRTTAGSQKIRTSRITYPWEISSRLFDEKSDKSLAYRAGVAAGRKLNRARSIGRGAVAGTGDIVSSASFNAKLAKRSAASKLNAVGPKTAELKNNLSTASEKLSSRRRRVSAYITATAGRAMIGSEVSISSKARPAKTVNNPLSKLLEKAKTGVAGRRRLIGAAMATALLTGTLNTSRSETSVAESAPAPVSAPAIIPKFQPEVKATDWSAPRAESRVVDNAPPIPVLADRAPGAVNYRQIMESGVKTPSVPASYLDSVSGQGEAAEVARLAAAARETAERDRYFAERAEKIGQLQPGQQIGTLRMVQTGESTEVGAPAGINIIEHAIRVGYYDPANLSAARPKAWEIDGGMKQALGEGAAIHTYGGSVPGIDDLGSKYAEPTIIAMHHLTPVNDPAYPGKTEAFRWPEKTVIADPEKGIKGDTLTMTVGDTMTIYEAVAEQLIDTTVSNSIDALDFGDMNKYLSESFILYNCAQDPEELAKAAPGTIPEADNRYAILWKEVVAIDLRLSAWGQ
jgi:hypothetical protein